MADDFRISLGFDDQKGSRGSEGTSFGVAKGLKMAGVVGILSKMKIVTDTIGIAIQLMSIGIVTLVGFIGGLLGLFISKVVTFFEDPLRALLPFGIFLVNGIITGLEFVLNGILGVFGQDAVELPRFQQDLVTEGLDAGLGFMKALSNSFMTNTEYQELLQQRAAEAQTASLEGLGSVDDLANAIITGSDNSMANMSLAFDASNDFAKALLKKSQEALSLLTGRRFSSSSSTLAQSSINLNQKASTNLSDKQSKAGLYFLNKIGG